MQSSAPRRRDYGQFCAIASALDVVGERWTLLIARDLLLGPKRYTDLREGLPGIATDLLTARLRTLEGAGLVARRTLPRPAPAAVYELTERGRLLAPALAALARVGFGLLGEPDDDTAIPPERVVVALYPAFRPDAVPDLHATYGLDVDGERFFAEVAEGRLQVGHGPPQRADLALRTDAVTLTRILQGATGTDDAMRAGRLQIDGPRDALDGFLAAFSFA
jgi:DNA-binding HxlR family transcriptional regulator